jgi:hypothetical protein
LWVGKRRGKMTVIKILKENVFIDGKQYRIITVWKNTREGWKRINQIKQ